MEQEVVKVLQKALKEEGIEIEENDISNLIEIPPSYEMGDYAFPCFSFSKVLKVNPHSIAMSIREKIGTAKKPFDDIQVQGAYINFFLDKKILSINLMKEILMKKEKYGVAEKTGTKTMIEFISPNTNKPLHIGHLRNMSIGQSVANILEFNGENVIRANLNNDRGIHICKSMAAYQKFGKEKNPEKEKSDHFVGKYYAMFGAKSKTDEKLEILSHRMLQKWEEGDKETIALWKKMNEWAFEGWKKSYKKFGVKFDKEYYESEIYTKGKEIILKGLKDGIFEKKKDGAVFINLEKEKLGEKILLRSDGTSVYMTQDIYLAQFKFKEFNLNNSIYVTGNEQDYHFQVLFEILRRLGFENKGLKHLSYGMITLPTGKIKSREGTEGISADEVLEKVQKIVKKELESRGKISKKDLEDRSLKISLASIRYSMLKTDIGKGMIFDPKEAINFEGNTGSYLLYSYARASSILKKIKNNSVTNFESGDLEEQEIKLIKKLFDFSGIVKKSYLVLNPSLIANYSYQLAQTFNEFYHACPVIGSKKEGFRIALVESFKHVLKNSLNLLGIETLEKM
ncbi:arginine--tRNA ligase [Candidatus Pacearchaeota archaeon]|nr:arginine--tRNA ligase [Candidatus Pacearchaeota archaeon]